jgi:type 1 fimbria pilin
MSMTQPQTTFPVTGCTPALTVPVTMGTFSTPDFTGAGSTAAARIFSIPLMNCPKGLGTILYSVLSVAVQTSGARA